MSSTNGSEQVLAQLIGRIPENKIRPRLEPTRRAVELLGDPQRNYRVIHITGTNGKTSTTRFIERILRETGLRTGRFTSPHLVKFNERIAIDGIPVADEKLLEVYQEVAPILEIVDQELIEIGEERLTFFEALAVLAFAVFADAVIDVLVLEVGMGGEWDSTNVADGDVAIFTPIGLDHMERLGNSIAEIAQTKSGIIKSGAIVVSSAQDPEALEILELAAAERAESLKLAGRDFTLTHREDLPLGQRVKIAGLAGEYGPFDISVLGAHQAENLAVAIAAVEAFIGGGNVPLSSGVLSPALSDISSPGRLQLLNTKPPILLDAAHNPAGAKILARALAEQFNDKPLVGVLAVLSDKDASGLIAELAPKFSSVIFTQSTSPRSSSADDLAKIAEISGIDAEAIEDWHQAIQLASARAEAIGGLVVVTGSISLVGDVLKDQEENEK